MDVLGVIVIFGFILITYISGSKNSDNKTGQKLSHEKRLVDKLMNGYDSDVRPLRNSSAAVVIRLGITLTQIFDLDEKNQVLTTNVWLDQEWYDDYLVWNPEEFGNLTKIRIPCEKLWLPDIVLYNSADDYTRGYMNSRAMLEPDGNVFWPPPTKFRSTCRVDVTYFPSDDQTCIMKMGSWIYDGLQVDVTNRTSEVDLSNYVPNGEWELLDARIVRNVVFYSCCTEPFPDVTVTLVIRRKTLYYMYNVVMPCMMMSILTLLVFCLPPESGEKIALGVTVLLAFSVFMLAIAEKMPETSESIPLLGIYLTVVMAITSISVVVTVVVLNFHYRGPSRKEVPTWLRVLVLDQLAHCFPVKSSCRSGKKVQSGNHQSHGSCLHRDANLNTSLKPPDTIRMAMEGLHDDYLEQQQQDAQNTEPAGSNLNIGEYSFSKKHCSSQTAGSCAQSGDCHCKVHEDILRYLVHLVLKQEEEDRHAKAVDEWRKMALVIDRFLFWIFFVVTLMSSLSFLVIVPFHRRGFSL